MSGTTDNKTISLTTTYKGVQAVDLEGDPSGRNGAAFATVNDYFEILRGFQFYKETCVHDRSEALWSCTIKCLGVTASSADESKLFAIYKARINWDALSRQKWAGGIRELVEGLVEDIDVTPTPSTPVPQEGVHDVSQAAQPRRGYPPAAILPKSITLAEHRRNVVPNITVSGDKSDRAVHVDVGRNKALRPRSTRYQGPTEAEILEHPIEVLDDDERYKCTVCDVYITTTLMLDRHLCGHIHHEQMEARRARHKPTSQQAADETEKTLDYLRNLEIKANPEVMRIPGHSGRPEDAVTVSTDDMAYIRDNGGSHYTCAMCDVGLSGMRAVAEHLGGRSHKNVVAADAARKRFARASVSGETTPQISHGGSL